MNWIEHIDKQYCSAISEIGKVNAVLMSEKTQKEFIDSLPALVHAMANNQKYPLGDTLMGYPVINAEIEGIRFVFIAEIVE